jgi:DNA repair protein RadD
VTFTLRPYQQEAVDSTLQHFRKLREPAVIVLPTGAGKSLVISELARLARGRVLVLTHVKELVEQNSEKFKSYGLTPGIFSAGLSQKDHNAKVIFGSIQSVARAPEEFFDDFSLLVIDECHRVSFEEDTQYAQVINRLVKAQNSICILGLTATPYRLDSGWIYQYNHKGYLRTEEKKFFKRCVYELNIRYMIENGYLTPPIQIDAPVASYDFSSLKLHDKSGYRISEIESILKSQKRITPVIIKNIVDLSQDRQGVIIFTSAIRHAEEILSYLPQGNSAIVIGDTPGEERDAIIRDFKAKKIKYLVNVSVLTTGFDAPHVDVIAILRPTESVGLYQQIVGRGLRLSPGKEDCLILDYTGVAHDIFTPEIGDRRPSEDSVPVLIPCPMCEHDNEFWGIENSEGEIVEHFGRKCRGAVVDPRTLEITPCGFRYRFKNCEHCGAENDIAAKSCQQCSCVLVDNDTKLKEAMSLKDAHVLRPDTMMLEKKVDDQNRERLEVRYYDLDAQYLSEIFYINNESEAKSFYYNFARMHDRLPGRRLEIRSVDEAISNKSLWRLPMFIVARKQKHFWKIREKIF